MGLGYAKGLVRSAAAAAVATVVVLVLAAPASAEPGFSAGTCDAATATCADLATVPAPDVAGGVPSAGEHVCITSGVAPPEPIVIGENTVEICPSPGYFDNTIVDATIAGVELRDHYTRDIYHSRQELRVGDQVVYLRYLTQ